MWGGGGGGVGGVKGTVGGRRADSVCGCGVVWGGEGKKEDAISTHPAADAAPGARIHGRQDEQVGRGGESKSHAEAVLLCKAQLVPQLGGWRV